ncbi:MAG: hypothetical protein ACOC4G_04520 [Bacillota bacterium]
MTINVNSELYVERLESVLREQAGSEYDESKKGYMKKLINRF